MDAVQIATVVGTGIGTAIAAVYARRSTKQLVGPNDPETGKPGPCIRNLLIGALGKLETLSTTNIERHVEVMDSMASLTRRVDGIEQRLSHVEKSANEQAQAAIIRGPAVEILAKSK